MNEIVLKPGDVIDIEGIVWDTDDGSGTQVSVDLPYSALTVTLPDNWTPEDSVADLLSDIHGFCIVSIASVQTSTE